MRTASSVSVLFTDLVGSTALASRLGADATEDLRRAHFALLREALVAHGGREVKNLGDGLMVAFTGVGSALDAAVAMQQAIDRHNRNGGEPLAIRIGVAAGDAEEEDGDLFGEPVVVAARLCAKADGGTILVPEVLRLLAPRGVHELRPIGDLHLKGLPEPVAGYEVVWTPAEDTSAAAIALPLPARLAVPYPTGFVGRAHERELLDVARKAAEAGERRGALLAGEAGMGKTRLVTETAKAAHDAGAIVLYGRCDEELAIPYQPWVEALGHYVASADDATLARHVPDDLAELGRVVPDVARRRPDLSLPTSVDAATDRHLLFRAVTSVLGDIARDQLCVLVLDDLHWADQATIALLRHALSAVDLGAVLVVGTYRDTDLDATHPLTDALAALHREPGIDQITLRGLDDTDIVAFVASIAGHGLADDGVALAHAVRAETEGNPFFVGEVLRHLADTGAIVQHDGRWEATVDLAEVGLPASVRAVVGQRVRRLGPDAHQALVAASVIGREFDLDLVVAVATLDEDAVLDALDAATAAGLVAETAARPDRFTFTHALVQHTLCDELTGARRTRLHHRVAEALEATLGDDPGDRIGELATHWLAATRPADRDKAITYARQAGDRAMTALAPAEAARWYTQALHTLDPDGDPRTRCELLIAVGRAQAAQAAAMGVDTLCEAGELAHAIGADDLIVAAATAQRYVGIGEIGERPVRIIERALDALGPADAAERATLLAALADHLQWEDPPARPIQLAEEATAVARRIGDPAVLIAVAQHTSATLALDRLADLDDLTSAALDLAAAASNHDAEGDIAEARITLALLLADGDEARAALARFSTATDLSANAHHSWWRQAERSRLALLDGDPARAEAHADEALAMSSNATEVSAYGGLLYSIRYHQGRLPELLELSEQVAADNSAVASFQAVVPFVVAIAGDHERARALLAEQRSTVLARADGRWLEHMWLNCMWLFGEAAATADDADTATEVHRQLLPWAHLVSATSATLDGPIARTLGRLAETLDRPDEALAHHEAALAIARRMRAPFHIANAEVSVGRLRSDATLVEHALDIARRHGYAAVEAAATAALDALR